MISAAQIFAIAGIWVLVIGFRGILVEADLLRRILSTGVMSTGVFLLLVAMANRASDSTPDPVPHGMILTGLIVSVSAIGLLLGLAGKLREEPKEEES